MPGEAKRDGRVEAEKLMKESGGAERNRIRPVGTSLRLVFEVPGGFVQADGIVRSFSRGEGMGVKFTNVGPRDRVLLGRLLRRLLH